MPSIKRIANKAFATETLTETAQENPTENPTKTPMETDQEIYSKTSTENPTENPTETAQDIYSETAAVILTNMSAKSKRTRLDAEAHTDTDAETDADDGFKVTPAGSEAGSDAGSEAGSDPNSGEAAVIRKRRGGRPPGAKNREEGPFWTAQEALEQGGLICVDDITACDSPQVCFKLAEDKIARVLGRSHRGAANGVPIAIAKYHAGKHLLKGELADFIRAVAPLPAGPKGMTVADFFQRDPVTDAVRFDSLAHHEQRVPFDVSAVHYAALALKECDAAAAARPGSPAAITKEARAKKFLLKAKTLWPKNKVNLTIRRKITALIMAAFNSHIDRITTRVETPPEHLRTMFKFNQDTNRWVVVNPFDLTTYHCLILAQS